jgi:hypothetical protein
MPLSHDLKKALLRARSALERNRNFRPPIRTHLDVRPPITVLSVKMEEGYTLEVEDSVRPLRDAWKLSELAQYVFEVEKIFMASVCHACVPAV